MILRTNYAQSTFYKWLVLALGAFTFTFVVAIPAMLLPMRIDEFIKI